jgi:hypothetical protein
MKRNTQARRLLSLLLLAVSLPLAAGCLFGEKRRTFSPQDDALLRAKSDPRLRKEAETGGSEPFAAIAVYRNDVFLDQSEALQRASLTVLNEMGNSVVLLLRPGQIVPLLKDPSLRKLAWFGPQGLLARLDPSLELDMISRYGAGTEDRDVDLLLRFVDVGGAGEERHVAAAGFRVVTRAGPNWVVAGPMSGLPKLLESDRIIYIEKAGIERAGVPVTKEVPHSKETIPEIRDREKTNPLPARGDTAIHPHKIPRAGNDNGMSIIPGGDQTVK